MRMSTQLGRSAVENTTKTDRFRPLSPMFPSAHLSAQKMSQTNSVSTCVSFTRCTGARVHGPDRTRHVRSWDGSWEVRNWHLDDLATPTRANNSTRQHKADASFGGIDTAAQAAEAAQWSDATATSGASTLRLRGARSYAVLNESHRSDAPHRRRESSTIASQKEWLNVAVHSKPRGREDARCPITKPLATQRLWPGSI